MKWKQSFITNQGPSHQGTFENHLCLQLPCGVLRLKEQKETEIVSAASKFYVCSLVDLIRMSGDWSCSVVLFTTVSLEEGQLCRGGLPVFQRPCWSHNRPTTNQGMLSAHDISHRDSHCSSASRLPLQASGYHGGTEIHEVVTSPSDGVAASGRMPSA